MMNSSGVNFLGDFCRVYAVRTFSQSWSNDAQRRIAMQQDYLYYFMDLFLYNILVLFI